MTMKNLQHRFSTGDLILFSNLSFAVDNSREKKPCGIIVEYEDVYDTNHAIVRIFHNDKIVRRYEIHLDLVQSVNARCTI